MFKRKKKYLEEIKKYKEEIVQVRNEYEVLQKKYNRLNLDYIRLHQERQKSISNKIEKVLSKTCKYAILVNGCNVYYFDIDHFRNDWNSIDFNVVRHDGLPTLRIEK